MKGLLSVDKVLMRNLLFIDFVNFWRFFDEVLFEEPAPKFLLCQQAFTTNSKCMTVFPGVPRPRGEAEAAWRNSLGSVPPCRAPSPAGPPPSRPRNRRPPSLPITFNSIQNVIKD